MNSMYEKHIKRIFDVAGSIVLIILTLPILLAVAILIKKSDREACVIFRQIRAGKEQKPFTMYKFRTMTSYTPPGTPPPGRWKTGLSQPFCIIARR